MSMGGPGDNPITDLVYYCRNQFPPDIADMLLRLHSIDPKIRDVYALDAYDWVEGRGLDEARAKLRQELAKLQLKKA